MFFCKYKGTIFFYIQTIILPMYRYCSIFNTPSTLSICLCLTRLHIHNYIQTKCTVSLAYKTLSVSPPQLKELIQQVDRIAEQNYMMCTKIHWYNWNLRKKDFPVQIERGQTAHNIYLQSERERERTNKNLCFQT